MLSEEQLNLWSKVFPPKVERNRKNVELILPYSMSVSGFVLTFTRCGIIHNVCANTAKQKQCKVVHKTKKYSMEVHSESS